MGLDESWRALYGSHRMLPEHELPFRCLVRFCRPARCWLSRAGSSSLIAMWGQEDGGNAR
ncbi:MAG: hypothetical protein ACLQAT_02195 [Candidatus Binataceae bacterium]